MFESYLLSKSTPWEVNYCLSGQCAVITGSTNTVFDFTVASFVNWSFKQNISTEDC